MGDIIKKYHVRSSAKEKTRRLRFYFDTGSPRTFLRQSIAAQLRDTAALTEPMIFTGLGDGSFRATHMVSLKVKLLGIWVPHLCYVVPDDVFGTEYDVLLGHDFMQIYDIHVRPKQREVEMTKEALKMALKVRFLSK